MPSFKPKSSKKIKFNKKSAVTLDTKHKEFLHEFSRDEDEIINIKNEIYILKNKLADENKITIEEKLEINDKIIDLKNKIKEIKSKKKDYFLDNSKFIFEYFENKKNISTGTNTQTVTNKSKLVNNFFKIKEESNEKAVQKENNNIVLKYLSNVSDDFLDINNFVYQTDICEFCHKGELIPLEEEGILVCNVCSRSIPYLK